MGDGASLYEKSGRHTGIDFQAIGDEDGLHNTPLLSVKDGIVQSIGYDYIGGY